MEKLVSPANKGSSAGVIIFSGNNVLLCKRATKCHLTGEPIAFPGHWSFIAGSIENKENAIDCIIREAKEEINLDINKKDLNFLESINNPSGKILDIYTLNLPKLPKIKLNEEHVSYMWYDYNYIEDFIYTIDDKFIYLINKFIEK